MLAERDRHLKPLIESRRFMVSHVAAHDDEQRAVLGRQPVLLDAVRAMADAAKASVEAIPDYKVRTPLQSSIMILKRHRDIMFVKDELNTCPISIIITTLAAQSSAPSARGRSCPAS